MADLAEPATDTGLEPENLGFTQQVKSKGGSILFNYCFFSGEVLTEPEIKRYGYLLVSEFELGIAVGRTPAGRINVTCIRRLALVTAKHLHQGDRVSLMGHLFCFPGNKGEGQERETPELFAMSLEFIRADSPVLGLVFPESYEEEA
jgi:hypothetical protein